MLIRFACPSYPGTDRIPQVIAAIAAANASSVAAGGPPVRRLTSADVGMPGHDSQEWDYIYNVGFKVRFGRGNTGDDEA